MKLYAQDGFGPGDKIADGLKRRYIEGAVLSARYRHPEKFSDKADSLGAEPGDLFMDPEYYAIRAVGSPNAKLGRLEEWPYFTAPRMFEFISGKAVDPVIRKALECQRAFDHLVGYIAPNLYIESSNSIDAAFALNFIGQTKSVAESMGLSDQPVYATLAVDRDVFTEEAFKDLLTAITGLQERPDGFYLLVGSGSVDEDSRNTRSELYHDHVIAGWMLLNHALSINGFKVINACADLISPLLGIAGAYACATGWSSGLRQFTMKRYYKPPNQGGSPPLIRYVSNALLSRVKQTDFFAYAGMLPEVENGLETDLFYDPETEDTSRQQEALQSWDALATLCRECITGNTAVDLKGFAARIERAENLWAELAGAGMSSGVEAQLERLGSMKSAIQLFKRWAEIL